MEKLKVDYKLNRLFVHGLFLLVLVFIVVRTFTVNPMLDELATFYSYIQSGHIVDDRALVDANNHLFVSFIGWKLYSFFGDHFFLFRLLSVISFVLYFYSLRFLVEYYVRTKLNWLVFIALMTTPWVVEYFGFARGYGPAIGFLFAGIVLIIRFKESNNVINFGLSIVLLSLSISSNLSLIIPAMICISYASLIHVIDWKSIKHKWLSLIVLLFFAKFLKFILNHIDKLKEAKALWWGSRDGLWEVTGKSVSNNVFFSDDIKLKYLLLSFLTIVIIMWIFTHRKMSLKSIIMAESFWIPGMFFGCLFSIVVLAEVFKVNYPMDRVAMYFIPLFILVLGLLFGSNLYLKWLLIALIWFPISFILRFSIESSIFSPEDRITNSFAKEIRVIKKSQALSMDYVSHLAYAYATRSQKGKVHLAIESLTDPTIEQGEFHVSWITDYDWKDFLMIYQDLDSKNRLYQRKEEFDKRLIFDTIIRSVKSNKMLIPLVELDLMRDFHGKHIQSVVEGDVYLNEETLGFNIVNQIENKKGETRISQRTRFEWYFGHKLNYQFIFPNYPMKIDTSDSVFSVFFQNEESKHVHIQNVHIQFFEVLK